METTNTTTKMYRIPEANKNKFDEKINKLVRKANKLGVSPITIRCIGEEFTEPNKETGKVYKYFVIEVIGEKPALDNWVFLGSLDITKEGSIIRTVPGVTLPEEYRHITESRCDHCHKRINRVNHHIVQHNETKEIKVVGTNCLSDFIGGDVDRRLAYCEYILRLDGDCAEFEDMDYCGGGSREYTSLTGYLCWVAMSIRLGGWISRKSANEWNEAHIEPPHKVATADSALWAMYSKKTDKPRPNSTDIERAENAVVWVRNELAMAAKSDYEWNLVTLAKADYIPDKAFGLAASIVSAYYRAKGIEVNKKYTKTISEYVGKEREKIQLIVTIEKALELDSDYGVTCMYRMRDEKGNILVWFASKVNYFRPTDSSDGIYIDVGHKVTIKGTIKKLEEYRGTKQTVLTRCKVLELHK